MNINTLLEFAYERIYNPIGNEIYQLGEYSYLMNKLIYDGTTYLHTNMSGYCAFASSLKKDFISFEIIENPDEYIIKDFKEAIAIYVANKFNEGSWVRYTFDKEKYFEEFLEKDIISQRNKSILEINSCKQQIDTYLKILEKRKSDFDKVNKIYSDLFITY